MIDCKKCCSRRLHNFDLFYKRPYELGSEVSTFILWKLRIQVTEANNKEFEESETRN